MAPDPKSVGLHLVLTPGPISFSFYYFFYVSVCVCVCECVEFLFWVRLRAPKRIFGAFLTGIGKRQLVNLLVAGR